MVEYEGTFHDPDELPTKELRDLCRNMCERLGKGCSRIGKMCRRELLSKVRRMLEDEGGQAVREESRGPSPRPVASERAESCFALILEALRMYVDYFLYARFGNRDEERAKVCLASARSLCEEACSLAVDQHGDGWEKANRVFNVVDRAMLKLRNDFSNALVSSCVMTSLLSEEHQARMAAK